MAPFEARTPSDFLFTYRGLLIEHEKVDQRFRDVIQTKDLEQKSALTSRLIVDASGRGPEGELSPVQNGAMNLFFEDPSVYPILPIPTDHESSEPLPASAPHPNDLKFIYQAMFASDSTSEDSEFAKLELAANRGDFASIEAQFSRLYAAQTGETGRQFKLTDKQRAALVRLTSDDFISLSPFGFKAPAVY